MPLSRGNREEFEMAIFDGVITELATKLNVGPKAAPLVGELLKFITGGSGGIAGFLDRMKLSGLAPEVSSWIGGTGEKPLPVPFVEKILNGDTLSGMASRLGLAPAAITAAAGLAIPKLVAELTSGGKIPADLPAGVSGFLGSLAPAMPAAPILVSSSPVTPPPITPAPVTPASITPTPIVAPPLPEVSVPDEPVLRSVTPRPAMETPERRSFGMSWVLPLLTLLAVGLLGLIGQMWWGSSTPVPVQTASAPAAPAASAPAVTPPAASTPAPAPAPTEAKPHLLLTNNNGEVTYGGVVKDEPTRTSIIDAIKNAFGADKVHGDIAIDPNVAPATWISKLGDLLSSFKINGLQALFDGSSIHLGGLIPDIDRDKLIESVKSLFGGSATVGNLSDATDLLVADTTAQAAASLAGLKAGYTARDIVGVLNMTIINFATSSAEVPAESKGLLKLAATKLRDMPKGTVIEIAGFTDNTGDAAANQTLSQQRADAVRGLLIEEGVDQSMLTAKGYGSASPAATNDTDAGRLRNRRIEYHVAGG
jgi:OOP family OmpA-OmpF porin